MFGLFGKKEPKSPEALLRERQEKEDWAGLARAYFDLGTAAMERGDLHQAVLWLHRADTIYSARDEIYDAVGEKLIDACSSRIGALEDAPLLYNSLPAQVEEKAEALEDLPLRLWGLLSMARLARLGERLSALPGCGVLGKLGWTVETVLKSFRTPISQEEYSRLMEICNGLYALGDAGAFWAGGEIEVPGGRPFQVFDLNGMMGVHLELNGYLDNHLRFLAALSQGQQPPRAECSPVGCTLLPDYYVRTGAARLEDVPQIQAELARIWSDFAFLQGEYTWAGVAWKAEEYQTLDILRP